MIIAIYATLGVFLLVASHNPNEHLSVVSFAIWSSIVHGAVMAVQSILNPMHMHHLFGDVPALFIIAAVLGFLSPGAFRAKCGLICSSQLSVVPATYFQREEAFNVNRNNAGDHAALRQFGAP